MAEVQRALQRAGWSLKRQGGNHQILTHHEKGGRLEIPRHPEAKNPTIDSEAGWTDNRRTTRTALKSLLAELAAQGMRSVVAACDHVDMAVTHQYEYTILLDPDEDDGGYTVTVPALPGVVTQGDTLEHAVAMAKDAIALYLEDLIADGEQIPTEHTPPQLARVTVAG